MQSFAILTRYKSITDVGQDLKLCGSCVTTGFAVLISLLSSSLQLLINHRFEAFDSQGVCVAKQIKLHGMISRGL
jgi:hypothetical protein